MTKFSFDQLEAGGKESKGKVDNKQVVDISIKLLDALYKNNKASKKNKKRV